MSFIHYVPQNGTPGGSMPHRRANSRVKLNIPARLILLTGVQQCLLTDLSVSGAGFYPENPQPPAGTSGLLQCGEITVLGEVIWVQGGRSGILFEEPLPVSQVVALRHFADRYPAMELAKFRENARQWVQGGPRRV